jgi:hypothetical protein
MSKVRIEVFMSAPPNPGSASLKQLLKEIEQEYEDKIEIIVYPDRHELYGEYNLNVLPALIIGELIKFVGFCPDKESVITGLKESGLD